MAVLITMTTKGDAALHGPPPASLLPSVPSAHVLAATTAGVPALLAELHSDTRNVLLTLSRIWTTAATGAVLPKDAAAERALDRLPVEHHQVMALARDAYLGSATDDWDQHAGQVLSLCHHLTDQIERLRLPDGS